MTKRNFLQNVAHKLVGARGSSNFFPDQFHATDQATTSTTTVSSRGGNFGQTYAVQEIAKNYRLVFLGEIHSRPAIVAFQCALQQEMAASFNDRNNISNNATTFPCPHAKQQEKNVHVDLAGKDQDSKNNNNNNNLESKQSQDKPTLHVIMEHFSFEMQSLLDDYFQNGTIKTFEEFEAKYHEIGTEGHALEAYRPLFEYAKENNDCIRVHAGFLPRYYARMLMREGPAVALENAAPYLPTSVEKTMQMLHGTNLHYNIFESLLSGRSPYQQAAVLATSACTFLLENEQESSSSTGPSDAFRGIFMAQLLKDAAMANKINQLLEQCPQQDKFLVIAGNGHLLHYCGVPERVLQEHPELTPDTCLVVSSSSTNPLVETTTTNDSSSTKDDSNKDEKSAFTTTSSFLQDLIDKFGPAGTNPGDFVYFYEDTPDEILLLDDDDAVKAETKSAYDKVGDSAHHEGNFKKAKAIMDALGYTEEEFYEMAGPDAYNFQGVGNPHIHAKIQPGETVLDVGSGLGIDSFIASHYAGKNGKVYGIDISSSEVRHAQKRAKERGLEETLSFQVADMEKLPFDDNTFDVVISNGAFCLAPNKEKPLAEILRVLKPGGRISICTSTIQVDNLQPGVNWPLCMKMFMQKNIIQPMCEKLGYVDVLVDDSDSSMTLELPIEVLEEELNNPKRNKVHVGNPEFDHLEGYDMDKICARVCIVGKKPKDSENLESAK